MTQSRVERAKSPTPSSDGLTPLHRAVLENDANTVRKIVNERELGVDVRTAAGTTPLMIAALYGRLSIFLYLLGKKASPHKQDSQGNGPLAYVKRRVPYVQSFVRAYKNTATVGPDRGGRRDVYVVLKAIKRQSQTNHTTGRATAQHEAEAQPQLPTPPRPNQAEQEKSLQERPARFVFLRSPGGKSQEFAEIRQVGVAKHGDLRRHCTGFIRAADGNGQPVFAISGWGIKKDKAARENVLGDMEYTQLVRQVSALLDFELRGNNALDHRFPGTPSEQKGAYVACHAEKKLAVYVLMEALSRILNTKELTINNIMTLKGQFDKVPSGLRETTIHLDHGFVCSSCVRFLDTLTQKTGLVFRTESHDWYTPGQRSQLQMGPDGQYRPVTQERRHSDSQKKAEIVDDELGLFDSNQGTGTGQESVMAQPDVVTPSTPTSRRPCTARQVVPRVISDPQKKGSPVWEEPQHHVAQYAKFDVTPPSGWKQSIPTPESHAKLTKVPRISMSPSPAGPSSASASENRADSMSPSLSQEFEVEEILQAKEEDDVQWYLVKWRGYPYDNNSWEPAHYLTNATDAINKFWDELRATQPEIQDVDVQKPEENDP